MITRVTEAKIQKQNQNGFDIGRKRYINRDISIHIHTYTHTKKLITCRTDIAKRFIDMSDDDGKQIAQQNRTPSMYVSMLIWNVMKVFYVKLSTYVSSSITFSSLRRRSSSREVEEDFICRKNVNGFPLTCFFYPSFSIAFQILRPWSSNNSRSWRRCGHRRWQYPFSSETSDSLWIGCLLFHYLPVGFFSVSIGFG